jgi:hypothetical protein
MSTAERLLQDEAEAFARLEAAFAAIPDDRFEEPTLTDDGWSPKDAMYHLSGWLRDAGDQLDRMREGTFDPTEETRDAIERQNRAWAEVSRDVPADEVRASLAPARRRLLEALASMEELTPDAIEWFEESGALHYAAHEPDLRRFLEGAP